MTRERRGWRIGGEWAGELLGGGAGGQCGVEPLALVDMPVVVEGGLVPVEDVSVRVKEEPDALVVIPRPARVLLTGPRTG